MTDPDLTVVAVFADGVSGSVLGSALESAGIPVEVRGGRSSWLFPGAGGGLGPVQVLVPRAFVAEARTIIAGLDAGDEGPGAADPGRESE